MSLALYRLGRACVRHRRRVLLLWIVGVLAVIVSGRIAGGSPSTDFYVPGVESQTALDLLEERFPDQAGAQAEVVYAAQSAKLTDPLNAEAIDRTVANLAAIDKVSDVSNPIRNPLAGGLAADQTIAFSRVQFRGIRSSDVGEGIAGKLKEASAPARNVGIQVEFGGQILGQSERGRLAAPRSSVSCQRSSCCSSRSARSSRWDYRCSPRSSRSVAASDS